MISGRPLPENPGCLSGLAPLFGSDRDRCSLNYYHPRMRVGNVYSQVCESVCLSVCLSACVCLSVCLPVQAITFELLLIETSFLVCTVADPGFSRGGREPSRGGVNTPNFPENCMKSKEFGRPGGGRASLTPPLDPPMMQVHI